MKYNAISIYSVERWGFFSVWGQNIIQRGEFFPQNGVMLSLIVVGQEVSVYCRFDYRAGSIRVCSRQDSFDEYHSVLLILLVLLIGSEEICVERMKI